MGMARRAMAEKLDTRAEVTARLATASLATEKVALVVAASVALATVARRATVAAKPMLASEVKATRVARPERLDTNTPTTTVRASHTKSEGGEFKVLLRRE